MVHIDYPRLILSTGPITRVDFTSCHVGGLHVELQYDPCSIFDYAKPDDVVFIYAVEFQTEVCQLEACAERRTANVAFDLPDLSEKTDKPINFHLYSIVEAANTACVATLSSDEKKSDKNHRNINRRVSPSIFIGAITLGSEKSFC